MHDGADALCAHDGPDEEGDAGGGHDVGFYGEEVADLVDAGVEEGQRAEPEEEEADEVHGSGAGGRNPISNTPCSVLVAPVVPDTADHEVDAGPADPALHAVPDARHGGAVEDGPQGAPDAEGGAVGDRERDVVGGADAAGEAHEAGGERVADPDAEPGLPPGEAVGDVGA